MIYVVLHYFHNLCLPTAVARLCLSQKHYKIWFAFFSLPSLLPLVVLASFLSSSPVSSSRFWRLLFLLLTLTLAVLPPLFSHPLLQANGVEFESKEEYMQPMNTFIKNNVDRVKKFFAQLSVCLHLLFIICLVSVFFFVFSCSCVCSPFFAVFVFVCCCSVPRSKKKVILIGFST